MNKLRDHMTWYLCYEQGLREPRFPVPAIPLIPRWPENGYEGMLYIDSLQYGEDDPAMVCCWDFYYPNTRWHGKYQHCYTDDRSEWYKQNGAWRTGEDI